MQIRDGRLLVSPSDLAAYIACPHLTQLELQVQRGELVRPHRENTTPTSSVARADEHEAVFLAQLVAGGKEIVEIRLGNMGSDPWGLTPEAAASSFDEAARRTEEALRAGAEVVYQGVLASGGVGSPTS